MTKMSAVGRSGQGLRWNIRQQLAELCEQGRMNDAYELLREEWEVWLTQKEEDRKRHKKAGTT